MISVKYLAAPIATTFIIGVFLGYVGLSENPKLSPFIFITYDLEKKGFERHFYSSTEVRRRVTVVLNVFRGAADNLHKQVSMLMRQNGGYVKEIWVCIFASPQASKYEEAVHNFTHPTNTSQWPRVYTITSKLNFKFHGRLLLAYMAITEYVLVIDDDKAFDENLTTDLLRAMGQQRGVWGTSGHVRDPLISKAEYYHYPSSSRKVDYLTGLWFLKRRWLEVIFREHVPTWFTGEDMLISFATKKYLNLDTFALDVGTSGSPFNLVGKSYSASNVGGGIRDVRGMIFNQLIGRGYVNVRSSPLETLVFVDAPDSGELFAELLLSCGRQFRQAFKNRHSMTPTTLVRYVAEKRSGKYRRQLLQVAGSRNAVCGANVGRTAFVFTGHRRPLAASMVRSARLVCRATSCAYVMQEKFEAGLRTARSLEWEYFDMRLGYGLNRDVDVPLYTLVSEMIPALVGILKNIRPTNFFLFSSGVCQSNQSVSMECEELAVFRHAAELSVDALNAYLPWK